MIEQKLERLCIAVENLVSVWGKTTEVKGTKAPQDAVDNANEASTSDLDREVIIADLTRLNIKFNKTANTKALYAKLVKAENITEPPPKQETGKTSEVPKQEEISLERIREEVKEYAAKHTPDEAIALLANYRAKKVSDLTPENRAKLLADLTTPKQDTDFMS